MVAKHAKAGAAQVILEETEAGRIRRDSLLRRLHFGEEPLTQLGAAFPVELFQREPEVTLNRAVKMELHLPRPRRS